MKYMGSKARHAKEIYKAVCNDLKAEPCVWVEPFVGGANMIDKVPCTEKIGNDINPALIALFKAVQNGYEPPSYVSEAEYNAVRANPNNYPAEYVAFVAIGCSYSGKWFGGYARGTTSCGKPRNYCLESKKNLLNQDLSNILFTSGNYSDVVIPDKSVVYCDPPYEGTTKYKTDFDHNAFWGFCDRLIDSGVPCYVSEYKAPSHWQCIWKKEVHNTLEKNTGAKKGIECLFTRH